MKNMLMLLIALTSLACYAAEYRTVMVDTNNALTFPGASNGGLSSLTLSGETITNWSQATNGITQAYADSHYLQISVAATQYLSVSSASTQYLSVSSAATQYMELSQGDQYLLASTNTLENITSIIVPGGILEFSE